MNTQTLYSLTLVTLLTVGTASAAPRTWSKGTGNYDGSMTHRPSSGARLSYRAPRVVREAPAAVAAAPSRTRRYSFDPAQGGSDHACQDAHAQAHTKPSDAPATVQSPSGARSTRRYSYEPGWESTSSPRMRTSRPSPNSLPKSDPRRYDF